MLRVSIGVVITGLLLAACGGHDKAGGDEPSGGASITIVVRDSSPSTLEAYATAVQRLGGAGTRVNLRTNYRSQDGDPEGATLAEVRSGKVPFALIYARVFDDLGVRTFVPLLAPLAIDSHATQQRVLAAGIADRALPALDKLGVVGVAVVPGTLRHPLGLTQPLLRPADFEGAYIGVRRSALAKRTFESLGATVGWAIGDPPYSFDGIETDLGGIESGRLDVGAASLTADVTLWPRLGVVVANPKAWEALSERRRKAMREAGRASLAAAIETLQRDEDEFYDVLCRRGATSFTRTTAADVAALRAAFAPVSAGLDADVLKQIADLRAEAGPAPFHPPCRPAKRAKPGKATPIDGAWEFTSTEADLRRAGESRAGLTPENWGHYVFAFSRGRWIITQEAPGACTWAYGTFSVRGHRTIWDVTDGGGSGPQNATNRPGEHFDYTWSRFKDTLELSPVRGRVSAKNFLALAWRRVGDDARKAPISRRCPPPPAGLQL
jgi:TRAP-type C4-dicarboxylate transport system substrate-binding protein